MQRSRKSNRKVEQKVDRLSALPDGVICQILSFLPTKLSVSTSILAKRWRFLWTHVPVLDFEFDYANPKRANFPGIVNMVMLRHKVQSLSTFRLTYNKYNVGYERETSIATVVEHNVQNLRLERLRVEVPRCLLTCKTLVDLTVNGDVSIPPTGPINLPNLKKLCLLFLKCEVDFTRLISACPVLEDLYVQGTLCSAPRGCYISSPTIQRLTIMYLVDSSMFINTPALRYLKVRDCASKHTSIWLCTSLVEADMSLYYFCEPDEINRRCVLNFLDSIRNVKSLSISVYHGKIWDGLMPGSIPKFGNLTKLEFYANWCFLSKFLESADHLQVLVIREDGDDSKHWMDHTEDRSACYLHSLRIVRIDYFRCTEEGFNMVRYILRSAQVLQRMEISCFGVGIDLKEKFDAICRISLFCRESKKCVLDFS